MSGVLAPLERAYRALAQRWIVVLCGNLVIVFLIVFALVGAEVPADAPGIVALQLAFSADRFSEIATEWGPAVVEDTRDTLWIDFLFAPVYALALSSALAWLTARHREMPPIPVLILFALPFVAALCDWIENTAHWIALAEATAPPAALVLLASVAAAIKWALLVLVLLAVLVQFAILAIRRAR